jgi:hypothetical protein
MPSPIPKPPGVPLLGNIFDIDPSNTWVSLKKLADKYGERSSNPILDFTFSYIARQNLQNQCPRHADRVCVQCRAT